MGYRGVFARKMFQTGVTKSITKVAMAAGNQRSREDDVISNSLLRPGSAAQTSPEDKTFMKAVNVAH
jgi:hypothetical protein